MIGIGERGATTMTRLLLRALTLLSALLLLGLMTTPATAQGTISAENAEAQAAVASGGVVLGGEVGAEQQVVCSVLVRRPTSIVIACEGEVAPGVDIACTITIDLTTGQTFTVCAP
jgi:hypothetical protein